MGRICRPAGGSGFFQPLVSFLAELLGWSVAVVENVLWGSFLVVLAVALALAVTPKGVEALKKVPMPLAIVAGGLVVSILLASLFAQLFPPC